jgi:hypothetical protein
MVVVPREEQLATRKSREVTENLNHSSERPWRQHGVLLDGPLATQNPTEPTATIDYAITIKGRTRSVRTSCRLHYDERVVNSYWFPSTQAISF